MSKDPEEKLLIDKIHDKEIDVDAKLELKRKSRDLLYVNRLMGIRDHQEFLQRQIGEIYNPKADEKSKDIMNEYAK